ncbi:LysR family transcriptional regulator [Aurantiacibacter sp. D1-12]|uniref:LysR family transcriptional regulator n=1 Tax=Aurantiacibacter sp. D1-12 TaxID=2993658 RepID=UPI00237CB39E|nr:LysR family transcriptional regulator [Aurantiacibacter sp. D1-12]MDE1467965.1 LysR family transcriptional regulator [Aurantiacibacter sp. D1-12]
MAIFVSVVDEKSFRGAAKKLLISPSVVSLHVKTLEQQIGAPLLYRSTRAQSLTREGVRLYEIAKKMVTTARDGLELFGSHAPEQLTDLRVAIPDTLVSNPIFSRITDFAKNHTGVRLNLMSSDIQQNMLRKGYDVAVRMGAMTDSDLKMKRISQDDRVVIASPEYVASKPAPKSPDDLKQWDFISFSAVPDGIELSKGKPAAELIWGKTVALADSVNSVCGLAVEGLGVATLPYYEVKPLLDDGKLVRILPEWSDRSLGIYVVWPRNADLNVATREFISHLSR